MVTAALSVSVFNLMQPANTKNYFRCIIEVSRHHVDNEICGTNYFCGLWLYFKVRCYNFYLLIN